MPPALCSPPILSGGPCFAKVGERPDLLPCCPFPLLLPCCPLSL